MGFLKEWKLLSKQLLVWLTYTGQFRLFIILKKYTYKSKTGLWLPANSELNLIQKPAVLNQITSTLWNSYFLVKHIHQHICINLF